MKESASQITVPRDYNSSISRVVDRFNSAMETIRKEYLRRHLDPWVVAYSGGKDSTLLLQLTWEVLASLFSTRPTAQGLCSW